MQLLWRTESTSRTSRLLRRKPGMLCLWTWVILDTKHQCVPLIRGNWRCIKQNHLFLIFFSLYFMTNNKVGGMVFVTTNGFFLISLRSSPLRATRSWVGRILTRYWWNTFVRNLPRSTSWMSSPSREPWFASTRSVKSWKSWWVPTLQTCRSTSSASWMTLTSLGSWTGPNKAKISFLSLFNVSEFFVMSLQLYFEVVFLKSFFKKKKN